MFGQVEQLAQIVVSLAAIGLSLQAGTVVDVNPARREALIDNGKLDLLNSITVK